MENIKQKIKPLADDDTLYSELSFDKMIIENKYQAICEIANQAARNEILSHYLKDRNKKREFKNQLKRATIVAEKLRKDWFYVSNAMRALDKKYKGE